MVPAHQLCAQLASYVRCEETTMLGSRLVTTLAWVGRVTVALVGRSRLSPCRLGRKVNDTVLHRRRARSVSDVDWFDGIEPDELAG
jgi:hypothetical protein